MKFRSIRLCFQALALITPLTTAILLCSCSNNQTWHKESGIVWNTIYNVTWLGPGNLADSIIPATYPVDQSLSVFNDSSIVAAVNKNIDTHVDSHFIIVYDEACRVNHLSGGMFDPTLSPAITAWGFGKNHTATTDTLRCDSLRSIVGIEKTHLLGDILHKDDPRIQFNFSALAKGYGVDIIAGMFRRNGVEDFMIEIGGEIFCSGHNSKNSDWRIAVDVPRKESLPGQQVAEIITLTNKGVASSGNYRNFHHTNTGTTYGHTISPLTCRPVETDILSATVVADNCMTADALATACMACGSEAAMQMCRDANADALFILRDSTVIYTPQFADHIER
ncbi:MAG: FAD:protein FMN transferase [Muribaculaceae bacterium]|nr:FAD:protein FMN transferase [Muribaculaceae bacterium]